MNTTFEICTQGDVVKMQNNKNKLSEAHSLINFVLIFSPFDSNESILTCSLPLNCICLKNS